MNKFEHAIKSLELICILDNQALKEDVDTAKEALEKQVQKKPVMIAMNGFGYEVAAALCCPSCGKSVINYWSRKVNPLHCMMCGQALDWSDENES